MARAEISAPARSPQSPQRQPRRWLWPALKALVVVAVVGAVGWQFAVILREPDLWERSWSLRPGRVALAAVLYLAGLGCSGFFWYWLLRILGQRPHLLPTVRAYYVGQLGRYIPGKVVGLAMRARLLTGPGVRGDVAVLTVVYESLTTIAAGVLLAVIWFVVQAPDDGAMVWRAAALLAVVGCLLVPGVFNRLAAWIARPLRSPDAPPLPAVRVPMLALGLAITAVGWLLQGGVLWALMQDLAPGAWAEPAEAWLRCTAHVAVAYAAGFLVLAAPGGLGVRDFLIQRFIAADLAPTLGAASAEGIAVIAALLLRLLWTVLDVAAAGIGYMLPRR